MVAYTARTDQSSVWNHWTTSSFDECYDGTSAGIWISCQTSGTSSTITASIDSSVWQNWQSVEVTAVGDTWRTWVSVDPSEYGHRYIPKIPQVSKEEKTALAREREERERKAKELEEQRKAAEERAVELLMDIVGPEEAAVYRETGNLLVKGHGFDWLIGRGGSVRRIEKSKVVSLCLHSTRRYEQPETDNVVALALHAKFAEEEMAKGNRLNEKRLEDFVMPRAAVLH